MVDDAISAPIVGDGLHVRGVSKVFALGRTQITAIESADVACPRISSTRAISGTGFMKCMPNTWSGRFVAAPSNVMEIDDVFEERMTSGRVRASR